MTDSQTMWAFPRRRPQLYSCSPTTLAFGVARHAFGRALLPSVQCGLSAMVLVPGARRTITVVETNFCPACGWDVWDEAADILTPAERRSKSRWLYHASSWRKRRSGGLVFHGPSALAFLGAEQRADAGFQPEGRPFGFRVPRVLGECFVGEWRVRSFEPLPALHRPLALSDIPAVARVSKQVATLLETEAVPHEAVPKHWMPMHGDFVPWNVRRDRQGEIWVIDWEDVGWGPRLADLVRYASAAESLSSRPLAESIARARRLLGKQEDTIAEAARFWLRHRNLQVPLGREGAAPPDLARHQDRARRERAILMALCGERPLQATDASAPFPSRGLSP